LGETVDLPYYGLCGGGGGGGDDDDDDDNYDVDLLPYYS